ncbi:MAG: hydrolase [Clostridiaceae bacterium]|nr:hydrolase [Clostridiaceae bacterium]
MSSANTDIIEEDIQLMAPESTPSTTPEASPTPKATPKATPKPTPKATPKATPKPTPKAPAATPQATSPKALAIINTAKSYQGVPYVWGGTTPDGFDCSGFIQYVFNKNGISLPRVTSDQYKVGTSVSKSNLIPGDLVFFETYKPGASHVGIYIGNNQFIHASSGKNKVMISSLTSTYYTEHYIGSRRVIK